MAGIAFNKGYNINGSLDSLTRDNYLSGPAVSRLHDINMERLKDIMNYFTHLKNSGQLNGDQFSALIKQACANFIENEFAIAFKTVLGNSLYNIFEEYEDE